MPEPKSASALLRFVPLHAGTMRGIALMTASTVLFAGMHVMVRHVSTELHPFQIAFFRNLFGLIVFLPLVWRNGLGSFRTNRLPMHGLRATFNVVAMLCFFYSLSIAPLARVTALTFAAPLFAAILSVILLSERFRMRRWMAIVIGFAGTLVILRPGLIPADFGSILALVAAMFWALTMIVIKHLSRTESSLTITGYMSALMSLLSLGPAVYVWTNPNWIQVGWLLLIAFTGTVGQIAFAQSLKDADTTAVMPFDFLKLVWISIFGAWIFAEIPDALTWLGAIIVFGSSMYIAWREHRTERTGPTPPDPVQSG